MDDKTGGGLIVKLLAFEIPSGFETATEADPVAPMSEAEMAADNCVAETNVVGRFTLFQRTTEVLRKF